MFLDDTVLKINKILKKFERETMYCNLGSGR